jgi:hypothetical protein
MQTTFETPDGTDPGATLSAAAPDAIPGGIPRGVEFVLAAAILRRRGGGARQGEGDRDIFYREQTGHQPVL